MIDLNSQEETMRIDSVKPMAKSRLKRFFDFQFSSVLRNSTVVPEKVVAEELHFQKDGFNGSAVVAPVVAAEFELSSVCLDSMVQNFIKENKNNNNNEKQSSAVRCSRNRCNCFNRNCIDSSSEDEWDSFGDSNYSSTEACEILKAIVLQQRGDLMELVDPELGSDFSEEEALRMIKVALLCTNPSPVLRPVMTAVVNMLEGRIVIDELARGPSIYGDEWGFEALRDQYGESSRPNSMESQSLVQSSNATWIGSSSTSAHNIYSTNQNE